MKIYQVTPLFGAIFDEPEYIEAKTGKEAVKKSSRLPAKNMIIKNDYEQTSNHCFGAIPCIVKEGTRYRTGNKKFYCAISKE